VVAGVAVVTDSTACLPSELVARYRIRTVPLSVVVGGRRLDDSQAALPDGIEAELRGGAAVSTASPAPERFAAAYAAASGAADAIVSVHLSGRISGTIGAASLAAAAAPVPVRVVDSGSLGMGLGFAVLSAAEAACAGGSVDEAAAAARDRSARVSSFFTVETPDYLRVGGRLPAGSGAPGSGAPGSSGSGSSGSGSGGSGAGGSGAGKASSGPAGPALTARHLLHVLDGRVMPLEKVRTRAAAVRRLTELAVESAAAGPVDLAIQYLGNADRASALAGRLAELVPGVRETYLARADPVIGIHTGPGMLGVVVAPY
jgi:fatty acid-binding protein DegV